MEKETKGGNNEVEKEPKEGSYEVKKEPKGGSASKKLKWLKMQLVVPPNVWVKRKCRQTDHNHL